MKTAVFFAIFGLAEIITNFFHLSHGSVREIGRSDKRQHREIPLSLPEIHFFIKTIIMLVFGILFFFAGGFRLFNYGAGELTCFVTTALLGIYGFLQALYYHREWRVWTAMIVYCIPLAICVLAAY